MNITYNWLKNYMDLSDVTIEQLDAAVTKGGLEVEGYEKQASASKLVVGEVKTCVMHPNSDHLHICTVDVGTDVRQIVCGAPNVDAGQKVIVALPGCVLPGGEIKAGVVRGEESNGMICSLAELGVDKKSLTEQQLAGIEILGDDAVVGDTKVLEYLGLDDTIFDVSLTPNRADCYSMWAAAKDIGAIIGKKVTLPDYSYSCETLPANLKVESTTDKCTHFIGKVINHVEIGPSPKWMARLLHSYGMKSINNVVDISNLVMLETGQPLHFYNLAKIPAREITVKTGLNEKYTALDGVEYQVTENDIMITTDGKAIGYAGIMGGDDSKIDEETTGIIIEAATFNLVNIRATSRRLDLFTEAATRFAKGIDPLAAQVAVERSTQLLLEYANASGVEESVEFGSSNYQPVEIVAETDKINGLLGTEFTEEEIFDVFERLDFKPTKINENQTLTHIPSYRTDIKIWQDLAEEVIRLKGYECITATLPNMPTTQGDYAHNGFNKRTIKNMLNGYGFDECITYSLVSTSKIEEGLLNIGQPVRIDNAQSEDRRFYRTSTLPSLLDVVGYNVARKFNEFALFEIGDVYSDEGKQSSHLSLALSTKTTVSKWQKNVVVNDFYTVKGIIIAMLNKLGYEENRISYKVPNDTKNVLHPNKSAEVYLDRTLIGIFGCTHPLCNKKYGIEETIVAELDLETILAKKKGKIKYVPIAKYPSVSYDLALVVKEEITAEQLIQTVKKAAGKLLKNVEIFDIYRGSNIAEGCKSVAVNVEYQSNEKTLSEAEVSPVHNEVLKQLSSKLGASLRD